MQQFEFAASSFAVLTLMRVLQVHFCYDENFWYSWCVDFRVLKDIFVSPKCFCLQSPHGTRYIRRALAIKRVDIGSFPFRSMLPIVGMDFRNDLILWSFEHLWSFPDKPRYYVSTIEDRLSIRFLVLIELCEQPSMWADNHCSWGLGEYVSSLLG